MKNKMLYEALYKAYNVAEGQFSNIPDCCIEAFNNGRTWAFVRNSLPNKEEKKRVADKWDYVPCEACLASGNSRPLKIGDSSIGEMLLYLMEKVVKQDEENIGNR